MRFRNLATGHEYPDIHAARRDFCAGQVCDNCAIYPEKYRAELNCKEWCEANLEKAAALMGLLDLERRPDIKKQFDDYCLRCKHNESDFCNRPPHCTVRFHDEYGILEPPLKFEPKEPEGTTLEETNLQEVDEKQNQRHFKTGAVRDSATGKGRYDLVPWGAIHALAQHCERGALHYGERNVDKGIPQKSLIDSGIRHLSMYIQGDAEEHHLVAALWNIAWACEQEIKRPEMVDLPERTEKSGKAV